MYLHLLVLPILINANIISDVENITQEIGHIFVKSMNTASEAADAVDDVQAIPQVFRHVLDIIKEIKNAIIYESEVRTIAGNLTSAFKNVTSVEDLSKIFSDKIGLQHCDGTTKQLAHSDIFEKHQELDERLNLNVAELNVTEESKSFNCLLVAMGDFEGSVGVRGSLQDDGSWKIDLIRQNC
ncbi:unnamed protein product [Caenorhabditis angaria]|uniref:Uncharacterized protein n=1 Tax=Caenorhabditis angaria TaxID=860376 RepID=A0A9P1N4C2_9PELO|nr:unnamed protein product [Caenorhabditis angaria]